MVEAPHASSRTAVQERPAQLERPDQHQNIQPAQQDGRDEVQQAAAAPVAPAAASPPAATATLLPKLVLLGAAALWGSYAPSVRLLYESAQPPDAVVVMAVRGVLQASVLMLASAALAPGGDAAKQEAAPATGAGEDSLLQRWLFLRSPTLWQAALELGLWNYAATALQVRVRCAALGCAAGACATCATCRLRRPLTQRPGPAERKPPLPPSAPSPQTCGLQLVGATRASFLVQVTVLLTPMLSIAAGYRPGRRVWTACGMALAGCLLITSDEAAAEASTAGLAAVGHQLGGDAAILLSALFYSLAVVRMTGYSRSLPSVQVGRERAMLCCVEAWVPGARAGATTRRMRRPPQLNPAPRACFYRRLRRGSQLCWALWRWAPWGLPPPARRRRGSHCRPSGAATPTLSRGWPWSGQGWAPEPSHPTCTSR